MKGKKALEFIFLRSAFTQRNLSSVGLVALFVGAYSILGGGVTTTPPNIQSGSTFGSVNGMGEEKSLNGNIPDGEVQPIRNTDEKQSAEAVIGLKPTDAEAERMKQIEKRGRLNDPDMPDEDGEDGKAIDKDALVQGVEMKSHREDWMMQRSEKRKMDNLSAIEDRLDVPRSKKGKYKVSYGDPQ